MQALLEFTGLDRSFWAHVRLASEGLGYSERGRARGQGKELRRYTVAEVSAFLEASSLTSRHLRRRASRSPCLLGDLLCAYLNFRAEVLEQSVAANLMDRQEAAEEFERLRDRLQPSCALPMNKQKREKRHYNYLGCIVNMLTEEALGGRSFDDEPRGLVVVTEKGKPLRTFARWMDGAYPGRVDPYAVWEVKEYYGTTTFGSRVADGVYETMLDGEEFAELEHSTGRKVRHYLMVDDRFTWWDCGRSYLCRIVDMLHMGLVDEVLFGRKVLSRWPEIVASWP